MEEHNDAPLCVSQDHLTGADNEVQVEGATYWIDNHRAQKYRDSKSFDVENRGRYGCWHLGSVV